MSEQEESAPQSACYLKIMAVRMSSSFWITRQGLWVRFIQLIARLSANISDNATEFTTNQAAWIV